ncbi:unnamed protein product [Allacma fusca]|uniref:F-box/LRR-repeat protein n=1 Tax=Allacma fusca TaxID=39272 RepID=A0A8J2PE58_9HEXA|nr:unnamed protein product [Allacma fusca]
MEVIGERRSLTRKFLHLLILEQLETLNLSFGTGEIHYGFQFLLRCKRLRDLNLSYLRHVEPRQLLSIIPSLSSIVSLNLQMTCAIDQVLEAIGNCCSHIQELNLTSTLVSDDGIFRMSGESQNDGVKRCQKLQRLIVTETRVSWVGALCALRCFPEIRDFDFDKIFQVFEHLDPESEAMLELPKLKLRSLYSVSPCIRGDSVDAASKICPNIELLSVMNAWIGNEMLYKFMQFENVRSVTIVNNDGMTLDYDEGVLPFLQVCGPQLENLILNKFTTVNLTSLGGSCPRLRKMALCNIGSYEPKGNAPVRGLFRCLTALELWFDDRTEFTSKYTLLQLLLDSVHISNLLVKKSDDFTLETLREIWGFNPMRKLARITLEECHSMTGLVKVDLGKCHRCPKPLLTYAKYLPFTFISICNYGYINLLHTAHEHAFNIKQ